MDLVRGLIIGFLVLTAATGARAQQPWADQARQVAQRVGLPEEMVRAVLRAESGGDPRAISRAGAMGLMQLMPDTWRELRSDLSLGHDPFAPADNLLAGATYLRRLYDRYGLPGALAAYNAGPGRYDAYLTRGRPLPLETRRYVAGLTAVTGSPIEPSSNALASPRPGLFAVRYDAPASTASVPSSGGLFVPRP